MSSYLGDLDYFFEDFFRICVKINFFYLKYLSSLMRVNEYARLFKEKHLRKWI